MDGSREWCFGMVEERLIIYDYKTVITKIIIDTAYFAQMSFDQDLTESSLGIWNLIFGICVANANDADFC